MTTRRPRIALVAPMVAPIRYGVTPLGGAQGFLAELARELAQRGTTVTLLAGEGSRVPGVRIPDLGIDGSALRPARFGDRADRQDLEAQAHVFSRVRAWLERHAHEFDVVHAHAYDAPAFQQLSLLSDRLPVVHTLHLPPGDPGIVAAAQNAAAEGATLIAVSRHSGAAWMGVGVPIARALYNGIRIEQIPLGSGDGSFVLCAGRLAPEKGTHLAIRAAREAGLPLVVAGAVYDESYYETQVRPRVGNSPGVPQAFAAAGAVYVGPLAPHELFTLMGKALATVLPVQWEEPFGLVAVESQAAGTPVVAFRGGALPEVVSDGRTGILVEPGNMPALAVALRDVSSLERAGCRPFVTRTFSLATCVDAHLALYAELMHAKAL